MRVYRVRSMFADLTSYEGLRLSVHRLRANVDGDHVDGDRDDDDA